MWKNYCRIAVRNIMKNKVFSIVNVFGLAIGMAACFFIFLFVHFEMSYDRFHKNIDRLYRVPLTFSGSLANNGEQATNHPAAGPALKQAFPEVTEYARLAPASTFSNASMMSYTEGDKTTTFNEGRIYMADPSFLRMFSFPFVSGNQATALSNPKDIVVSASTAQKYFGNENPIGKTLSFNRRQPFKVTGVFKDIPENSHIKFDILVSMEVLGTDFLRTEWTWPEFYTYVLLAPGADPRKLEAKFPAFIQAHMGDKMKQLNYSVSFQLQPVRDIHLRSNRNKEAEANGSEKEIYFLSIIGIFVLVIAWINYINLSTAKSVERAKEVGLRKAVGALKIQLIGQFIVESVVVNLLAVCVAALIVWICYPFFGRFISRDMHSGFSASGLFGQGTFWLGLTAAFLVSALLVGAYPAFVLSAFRPVLVLKGRLFQSAKGIMMRKTMVSFQFLLSILLIAGAITVYSQLTFMRNQALGYNKDQVLVIKAPAIYDSTIADKMSAFKNEIGNNPAVSNITVSTEIPGKTIGERNTVRKVSEDETHNFTPFLLGVDDRFISTYQMDIMAGRGFAAGDSSPISRTVHSKVMVNEALARGLGYKDDQAAVGQPIIFRYGPNDLNGTIIGVVKNYHQRSLREGYDPILYYYPSYNAWSYISIRFNTSHVPRDLASFEKIYKNIFQGNAVEYFFLDDYFNQQYQADQRFGKVFGLFTGLTIFVACLGLLGLSSFVIRLRTKEIGIRKVLGASIYSLLVLFSLDFIRLVCLASVIALPIIYFMASRWLDNYAFHIHLNWVIFVMPPVLLLIISLMTISLHSVRAALANPVKSLKTE